jgi:DNA-binding transcriptional MerR regulator
VADELVNIGTFALQTGLSTPMLRYYHEIGVLEPGTHRGHANECSAATRS